MPDLFNVPNQGPTVDQTANRLLREVNINFQKTYQDHVRSVEQFWKHDLKETPYGPTGVEVLRAMGTNAYLFLSVAYARVQMLATIQQLLGRTDLVDITKMLPPYTLTFNEDGSLNEAILIEEAQGTDVLVEGLIIPSNVATRDDLSTINENVIKASLLIPATDNIF